VKRRQQAGAKSTPSVSRKERERLADAAQTRTGILWIEKGGQLTIGSLGANPDHAFAREPLCHQLRDGVVRKSRNFAAIANRLDNAIGWNGIGKAAERFATQVDCGVEALPERLGFIYDAILELGSFLELDARLRHSPSSAADPLDPEVRRVFTDLIRTAAPWLRRFPTICELDDDLGAFLVSSELLDAAEAVVPIASREELVSTSDAELIHALANTARRGDFQGRKAGTRTVHSVRNLVVLGTSLLATVYISSIGSKLAEKSVVADRTASVLLAAESYIVPLFADLSDDIRIALLSLLDDLKGVAGHGNPASPTHQTAIVPSQERLYPPGGDRHLPDLAVFRDAPFAPEMVVVPAGEFVMGSPDTEGDRYDDEGPQHRVTFANGFAIGRYPVTFDEYDRFCDARRRRKPDDQGWGHERRPVINVSGDDARAYAAWLSRETGRAYRLPSEAEWEYACRAGTTTRYGFGDEITPADANFDESSPRRTSEVGAYKANRWGLYDMHGNVWEWVEDDWHDNYNGAPEDGTAWRAGRSTGRIRRCVLRGGSWGVIARLCRSAVRIYDDSVGRNLDVGFRVARTLVTS
jgi:formylglycine-generating enzyme required for sulfatase activity